MIILKIRNTECGTTTRGDIMTITAEAVIGVKSLIKLAAESMGIPQSAARDMLFHIADATEPMEESNSDD